MTFVVWYFGVGAILLAPYLIWIKFLSEKTVSETEIPAERSKELLLLFTVLLPFWALFLPWQLWDKLTGKEYIVEKHPEFTVKTEDLKHRSTIEAIEPSAMVYDPLGAVPDLPFGHLNPVWEEFKDALNDETEIWSFTAHYKTEWGSTQYKEGYVAVIGKDIGLYFLMANRFIN